MLIPVAAALAIGIAIAVRQRPDRPAEKPVLLLLTSLPLVFGEEFGLQESGSPALTALSARYRVRPISTTGQNELAKGGLLLMAQPPAQAPENLVALDEWVRRGGRVLLLADPMLEWPSKRPLGDPLRPPPMFTDTGLLAHWGLRLDAPDKRGPARRRLGGTDILTTSPGTLHGGCAISSDRLVADCRVGNGRARVIADADLLNADALGDAQAATLPESPNRSPR
ncbi:MAG TPA: hypothetical protein VJT70_04410 [Sphingomicrobium sp.]|nr:hypothetical protein [Sphingomicrobium sp.]